MNQQTHLVNAREPRQVGAGPSTLVLAGEMNRSGTGGGCFRPSEEHAPLGIKSKVEVGDVTGDLGHRFLHPLVLVEDGDDERGRRVVRVSHDRTGRVGGEEGEVTASVVAVDLGLCGRVHVRTITVGKGLVQRQLHVVGRQGVGGTVTKGFGVAVAQTPLVGNAPALHLGVGQRGGQAHQTGKLVTDFETHVTADIEVHSDGGQVGAHFPVGVAAMLVATGRTDAQLTVTVAAPTLHHACGGRGDDDAANVVLARVHDLGVRGVRGTQVDGAQGTHRLAVVVPVVGDVALTELPDIVAAPTTDGVVAEGGAGETVTGAEVRHVEPAWQADVDEVAPHVAGVAPDRARMTKPQLTEGVVAPTGHVTGVVENAGVVPTERKRGHGGA